MKKIIFFSLLFALPAVSCPNLTGTYSCVEDGETTRTVVSQSIVNGATVYHVETEGEEPEDMIADGVERVVQDDQDTLAYLTVRCNGNIVEGTMRGSIRDQGNEVGQYNGNVNIQMTSSNTLSTTGLMVIDFGGGRHEQTIDEVCTKL